MISPDLSRCIVGGACAKDRYDVNAPCALDANEAIAVQNAIAAIWDTGDLYPVQSADLHGTRAWLQIKLWTACIMHGLISPQGKPVEIGPTFPISVLLQLNAHLIQLPRSAFDRNGKCMVGNREV